MVARRGVVGGARFEVNLNAETTAMTELKEHDGMICRACGKEERASEGYPCNDCGTFICLICEMRGVTLCAACQEKRKGAAPAS